MLKLARRARGHFVTLIEICVHIIRVKPGHISSLQGLHVSLEEKDLQGCIMSGNVLVLCKGGTTSQDMGDTFRSLIT